VLVTVRQEILRDVLVTRRPLPRGHLLSREDVETRRMDVSGLPADVISRWEDAVGKKIRRGVGPREVVRSDWLELPVLVDKGDRVVLVAEQGGLRVTALGEVKRKGRLGERIPVLNLGSNKAVFGHLVDARTVRVAF
jgi:flagella basal body P-ring formation protein FlgA